VNSKPAAEFCIPGSIAIQMKPETLNAKLELLESAGFKPLHILPQSWANNQVLMEERLLSAK